MWQSGILARQIRLLLIIFVCSFFGTGGLFWISESGAFTLQAFSDTAWWWFITSTTVGYGDVVPATLLGRFAGVIATVVGIYGYTNTISIILQRVTYSMEARQRGLEQLQLQNHVLICEYTAFADELIQEIATENLFPDQEIAILGSLVQRNPYPEHHFVYGVPLSPVALKQSCAKEASLIFVFANTRFSDPDLKTLHVVSRIMKVNTTATMYVEMCDPDHPMIANLPRPIEVMKTADLIDSALSHRFAGAKAFLS